MNVLLIGNGGREHALAKVIKKSKHLNKLYCAGNNVNPGINKICDEFIQQNISTVNFINCNRLLELQNNIDLVIIGPEKQLENGLVDRYLELGIRSIGPTQKYAQIETSKIFARNLFANSMYSWVNPKYKVFNKNQITEIKEYANELDNKYVIKPDGLMGGKGVKVSGDHIKFLSEAIDYINTLDNDFIIEEKLQGVEFSLFSFCDGKTLIDLPLVRDHKRLLNDNLGPNTGGMGSYTFANGLLEDINDDDRQTASFINKTAIELLQKKIGEQYGYRGILYGSYMKTYDGEIKLIEFNARFGDPEAINLLHLLETDFLEICDAIINQNLHKINIKFAEKASVCKYLVPHGYPYLKKSSHNLINLENCDNESIIYGDCYYQNNNLYSNKSRTLAIIKSANTLDKAYKLVEKEIANVKYDCHYRSDIGKKEKIDYEKCGVNVDKNTQLVKSIEGIVNSKFFGGLFDVNFLKNYDHPMLLSSCDGVGTKTILAEMFSEYDNIGYDLVNHCVNDILVHGAQPLFFLDYYAQGNIKPENVKNIITSIAYACDDNNCQLIGGETAEMPDVYREKCFDIAGTIVGVVEKNNIIDGSQIKEGDIVIALPSDGLHTNGYSLVRKVFSYGELSTMKSTLLKPHKSYLRDYKLLINNNININGLCHITGGGLVENPPRILPKEFSMKLDKKKIKSRLPTIFRLIKNRSNLNDNEMFKTFNCGIGMLIIVNIEFVKPILEILKESFIIGEIVADKKNNVIFD